MPGCGDEEIVIDRVAVVRFAGQSHRRDQRSARSFAWQGIMHKKHVVMLNVETDVTVGLILSRMAEKMAVAHTASTGDEPNVRKATTTSPSGSASEVVCLGKGKNNPPSTSMPHPIAAAEG